MNVSKQQKEIARWAIDYAINNGCSEARVSVIISTSNSFEYRNEQLDKLQQNTENKFYIELFIDGRYGSFSTNRMEKDELEHFIAEGITSTKLLSPDPCRRLPDSNRYFKGEVSDLGLYDNAYNTVTTAQKIDLAKEIVNKIYGSDSRIISVSSYFNDGRSAEYMIASNGFEAETHDTAFSLGAEVSLKTESDARPEGYWSESSIMWDKLVKTDIAEKAMKRAIGKIGQIKVQSGKYDMLLDNRISSRLIAPIISAISGSSLQQKSSFLLDKLGSTITSSALTLTDKPHLAENFGARWFDGEGVATKDRIIINKGVLNAYFIDTYSSLKMDTNPTIASPSVIVAETGELNFDQLLTKMNNGIWVTGFNGGNSNPTTGDFSFGVEGFLIENGSIKQPIGEMNITGNMLDLWLAFAEAGNDLRPNTSWQIPSLLFKDVNFSGL